MRDRNSNDSRISRRRLLQLACLGASAVGVHDALRPLAAADTAGAKRVLRMRTNSRLESLDPAFTINQIETAIIASVLPMLIETLSDGPRCSPLDAERVEQLDATHIRFVLREGLTWSNGFGPVTAHDVKASFERIADPKNGSYYSTDWFALDHVEVKGEREGVIVLKEPFTPLFSTLTGPAGAILPAAALRGQESRNFGVKLPAIAGPYRFKQSESASAPVLERNPGWRGAQPTFDEIRLIVIADDKAAEIAYDAGEVDVTRLAASSVIHYASLNLADSTITKNALHAYYWVGMRIDHPKFRDIRVRRAIQQAINIDELVEGTFFGSVAPATGMIAPGVIGHRQKSALPPYDPAAAKALLAQAGFPHGFKTVITTTDETELVAAATIVATQLRQIGISAEVAPEDKNSVWVRAQGPLKFRADDEMIVWQFGVNPDPYWYTTWFTPDQIGKWNWERWNSPEFGRLAMEGGREADPEKRQKIYTRMADLMDASGAYVFFANGQNAVIHRRNVNYRVRANPLQPALRFI